MDLLRLLNLVCLILKKFSSFLLWEEDSKREIQGPVRANIGFFQIIKRLQPKIDGVLFSPEEDLSYPPANRDRPFITTICLPISKNTRCAGEIPPVGKIVVHKWLDHEQINLGTI